MGVSVDSTGNDWGTAVTVDTSNNIYLGGLYGIGAATVYNTNNVY
jgi:hypothetical protein